jgi:hypothetical protein
MLRCSELVDIVGGFGDAPEWEIARERIEVNRAMRVGCVYARIEEFQ